jgi:hypothetical protein
LTVGPKLNMPMFSSAKVLSEEAPAGAAMVAWIRTGVWSQGDSFGPVPGYQSANTDASPWAGIVGSGTVSIVLV